MAEPTMALQQQLRNGGKCLRQDIVARRWHGLWTQPVYLEQNGYETICRARSTAHGARCVAAAVRKGCWLHCIYMAPEPVLARGLRLCCTVVQSSKRHGDSIFNTSSGHSP